MIKNLLKKDGVSSKIVLIVLDGLGGLPIKDGMTELEIAKTPNLDKIVSFSATGCHIPVDFGITPGSGPGHLALFGYDPTKFQIGRGILEALGLGLEVGPYDITARGNYATIDKDGKVVDRRAGRIKTEENIEITQKLSQAIKNLPISIKSGKEHRLGLVFHFNKPVESTLKDTDPQSEGLFPKEPEGNDDASKLIREFLSIVKKVLKDQEKANYILLRGFARMPEIESFNSKFNLKSCAIAVYPMYKGIAKLVGMEVLNSNGESFKDQINTLKSAWGDYDFFFLHYKKTDSAGEDGNYELKISAIEEFDSYLPEIMSLNPNVIAITGDHSTPSIMKSHSWHPVPVLIYSKFTLGKTSQRLTERECLKGELGIFPTYKLINYLLAHSLRLEKFGA
ncbi:MAG: 2,3-bisphosphoglycerate-independent phosphoglycerate mutase [Aquificaceae bacterium]|nr:2,3-bisphosphoglycerate-independent phosphoglycerate mutase [Aquificaceae bacterium]MDW8237451.1 2,3-bisphosphoglycerate-independent phosphoglycerate mutase [Aquificaceae bacterium]